MKKIAIDTSGISEKYGIRGAGFYAKRLIKALQKINVKDCQISSFNFKEASKEKLLSYSLLHYPYFDPFFSTLPLKKVPFQRFSNDFVFDQEILISAVSYGFKIGEIPVPVRYFREASSINLIRSIKYGLETLKVLFFFALYKTGIYKSKIFK